MWNNNSFGGIFAFAFPFYLCHPKSRALSWVLCCIKMAYWKHYLDTHILYSREAQLKKITIAEHNIIYLQKKTMSHAVLVGQPCEQKRLILKRIPGSAVSVSLWFVAPWEKSKPRYFSLLSCLLCSVVSSAAVVDGRTAIGYNLSCFNLRI